MYALPLQKGVSGGPSVLTVPEPQKLSPLLLSPTFSASSFSALPSPLSGAPQYQTSITSPPITTGGEIPGETGKTGKGKNAKGKKDMSKEIAKAVAASVKKSPMLTQEQEKQWKMLQVSLGFFLFDND